MLVHPCLAGFSLVVANWDYTPVSVGRLLNAMASVVAGTGSSVVAARGLSNCASRTLEHRLNSCG